MVGNTNGAPLLKSLSGDANMMFTTTSGSVTDVRIRSAASGAASSNSNTLQTPGGQFKITSLNVILNTAGAVTLTFKGYKNGTLVATQAAAVSTASKNAITFTAAEWSSVDDVEITGYAGTGIAVDDIVIAVSVPVISYTTPQTYIINTSITPLAPNGSATIDPYGFSGSTSTFGSLGTDVPYSLTTDVAGNVYVIDNTNSALYKYTSTGTRSTLATVSGAPINVAVDPSGYIYVTDYNTAGKLYRYNNTGGTRTLLGTYTGLNDPIGVTTDAAGNVYVANSGTNTILKMAPGVTGTVAITGANTYISGFPSGNGVYGITFDISGNLYVSDYINFAIYKIAASTTTVTTFINTGLNAPRNMSFDAGGNLYVADYGTGNIFKITPAGALSTLVTGLSSPRDVQIDPSGNMYIANSGGFNILKDLETGGYAINTTLPAGLSFDTATGIISGTPTATSSATNYTITGYNLTGSSTTTVNIAVNSPISVTNLTGPTTSPLYFGQTGDVLFGFTVTNNATYSVSASAFDLQTSSATTGIFGSGVLYKSTTSTTYPTGFATAGGSVTFGSTDVTVTGLSETIAPGASVSYYLVANFTGTSSVSGSLQFSLSTGNALITSPTSYAPSNSITGTSFTLGNVYNWRGNSSNFAAASSYLLANGTTTSSVVPGTNDIVQIGVIPYQSGGTTQPVIIASTAIKQLVFGSNSSPSLTFTTNNNKILTVSNDLIFNSGAAPTLASTATGGTIAVGGSVRNNGGTVTQSTAKVTVVDTLYNNSGTYTQSGAGTMATGTVVINGGTYQQTSTGALTVTGNINNSGTYKQTSSGGLTLSGTLNNNTGGDFTLNSTTTIPTLNNSGTLTSNTGNITVSANLTNSGAFSQTGSGKLTVTGTTTTNTGSTMALGTTSDTFTGNITNGGTITEGTGGADINGATFTNSGTFIANGLTTIAGNLTNTGTFTPGTAPITFDGTGNSTLSTTSPIIFTTLTFTNGITTLSSGNFIVSSAGTLTMSVNSTLAAGGNLTLASDATGTGRIFTMPTSSSITGNVNVQRYFTGAPGLTPPATTPTRGYRLISSPVNSTNTSTGGSAATFTMSNLTNLYTGGPAGPAGGFSVANAGTSTVFLYREDVPPVINTATNVSTSYNSGNYKGFYALNVPSFTILQTLGTYSLYAGDGVLLYYAGSNARADFNSYKIPDNAVAVYTGTLNQGSIPVKLWYNASLNFTSTATSNPATGFALVGNPYASTIDLNTFGRTVGSGLYSPGNGTSTGLTGTFYEYNYTSKIFDTYQAGGTATGSASRYIPSGQGFFVKAAGANATLTFNEAAKVTSQPSTLLMGLPVASNAPQLLRVKFSQDVINTQDIAILFEKTATNGYDLEYDADYLGGIGNVISISSFAQNSKKPLSINHMHAIDSLTRIKLSFAGSTAGVDTLSASGFDSLDPRYDVYLVDHYKKDSTIFTAANKYLFSIKLSDTSSFGSTRFELAFHKKTSLANYKLLSFTATKIAGTLQAANTGILLSWKVQNENKYTGFTIQRADGSLQFLSLYSLQSDGSGTYTYTDHAPLTGVNNYRLMQNGAFDQISYSETVTIAPTTIGSTENNPITLYPNPVVNQLQISIGKNPPSQVHLTIMNTGSGLVMMSKDLSSANIQENVSALFAGNYIVEISDISTKKIIGRKKFVKL